MRTYFATSHSEQLLGKQSNCFVIYGYLEQHWQGCYVRPRGDPLGGALGVAWHACQGATAIQNEQEN